MLNKKLVTALVFFLVIASSCSKSSTSTDSTEADGDSQAYNAETAAAVVGSASGAAEGSVGLLNTELLADEIQKMDYLDPESANINPKAACSLSQRSSCNSGVRTIDWGGCSIGTSGATLSGIWTEIYNDTASCSMASATNTVNRRPTTGITLTINQGLLTGATLTTDTSGGTAYDGTTSMGSTGILVANTDNVVSGTRAISIDSIHKVLKGPKGSTWFDYFIKTGSAITVSGTRSAGNRTISSGTLSIYHNKAKYTASHSFSNVVWGSSSCCYPTAGAIASSFSGTVTGTTSMTFTSTCGTATFVDTNGTPSNVTLSQCE